MTTWHDRHRKRLLRERMKTYAQIVLAFALVTFFLVTFLGI